MSPRQLAAVAGAYATFGHFDDDDDLWDGIASAARRCGGVGGVDAMVPAGVSVAFGHFDVHGDDWWMALPVLQRCRGTHVWTIWCGRVREMLSYRVGHQC
eukprot:4137-Chlamydomonas_euryale.AAC.2